MKKESGKQRREMDKGVPFGVAFFGNIVFCKPISGKSSSNACTTLD
jgi:hypothetical protein